MLEGKKREGIIEKIDTSEWAAPFVIVPKPNVDLRNCGDYPVWKKTSKKKIEAIVAITESTILKSCVFSSE